MKNVKIYAEIKMEILPNSKNSDLKSLISSHERASYHSAHPLARAVKIGSPRLEVQAAMHMFSITARLRTEKAR